jgi:hypothetical protein
MKISYHNLLLHTVLFSCIYPISYKIAKKAIPLKKICLQRPVLKEGPNFNLLTKAEATVFAFFLIKNERKGEISYGGVEWKLILNWTAIDCIGKNRLPG